jgi:hypothetical protein
VKEAVPVQGADALAVRARLLLERKSAWSSASGSDTK